LIIVVAEGDENGGALKVAEEIRKLYPGHYVGTCILGHIQRGGAPSCADRILASRLGVAAVEALLSGSTNVMTGIINNELVISPLKEPKKRHFEINESILRLFSILSC
jgi:6-phosphofructokinase 1